MPRNDSLAQFFVRNVTMMSERFCCH